MTDEERQTRLKRAELAGFRSALHDTSEAAKSLRAELETARTEHAALLEELASTLNRTEAYRREVERRDEMLAAELDSERVMRAEADSMHARLLLDMEEVRAELETARAELNRCDTFADVLVVEAQRAARAETKAELETAREEVAALKEGCAYLRNGAQNARAVMAEEAKRLIRSTCRAELNHLADQILALAPLPASLQVVEVAKLEALRAVTVPGCSGADIYRAALAVLEGKP